MTAGQEYLSFAITPQEKYLFTVIILKADCRNKYSEHYSTRPHTELTASERARVRKALSCLALLATIPYGAIVHTVPTSVAVASGAERSTTTVKPDQNRQKSAADLSHARSSALTPARVARRSLLAPHTAGISRARRAGTSPSATASRFPSFCPHRHSAHRARHAVRLPLPATGFFHALSSRPRVAVRPASATDDRRTKSPAAGND